MDLCLASPDMTETEPALFRVHYYACMVSANPVPHSSDCMLVSVLPQLLVVGVCWAVAFETSARPPCENVV